MTYLVTGGSGFIGSHLVEQLLKNGHSVINVDNFDTFYDYRIKIQNTLESVGKEVEREFEGREIDLLRLQQTVHSENYSLKIVDIRDLEALRKVFEEYSFDLVVHLAALAGVRPSIERPLEYEEVNIKGTQNLWELCKEFGIKKFVNASSSSVYGNNETVPFAESDPVNHPISPYAATKRATEILGHVYYHLYGINMVHLRFFTVYGPRQRPDLAIHKFTRYLTESKEIPFYGDGSTKRDYTYIDDIIHGVSQSIRYLEENEGVYEIINLGENQVVSLNEMLESIEKEIGAKSKKNPLPMQPGDVEKTYADISKARALLGYSPGTSFQNGIKKFVEWFLRKPGQNEAKT